MFSGACERGEFSPEVLKSPEWADAVEQGRWPSEVRPYTSNRRHVLYRVMESDN